MTPPRQHQVGLAASAWHCTQKQVFTHTCAALFTKPSEAIGAGELVEVAITPGDYAGCSGARVCRVLL